MKAKQRTLLLLVVLLALAGATLALLNAANRRAEEAASAAEAGTIVLSSFAVEDLTRIEYTWQGETITLDYDGSSWTLADDPDYHLDQTRCNTMATALADLRAKRALTAEAGEDYGLDVPLVTVSVTAAGETNTFTFGDTNPITGDIYLRKTGDDAVYTASSSRVGSFEYGKADLFGAFNPAGITASSLEEITYSYGTGADAFTVSLRTVSVASETDTDAASSESDSAAGYTTVWRLAGDTGTALDEEAINDILSALGGYVSGQITGADPAAYGFDAPLVTVAASDGTSDYTLYYAIGADGYYMMVEGDSSVYTVDGSVLDAFALTGDELKTEAE